MTFVANNPANVHPRRTAKGATTMNEPSRRIKVIDLADDILFGVFYVTDLKSMISFRKVSSAAHPPVHASSEYLLRHAGESTRSLQLALYGRKLSITSLISAPTDHSDSTAPSHPTLRQNWKPWYTRSFTSKITGQRHFQSRVVPVNPTARRPTCHTLSLEADGFSLAADRALGSLRATTLTSLSSLAAHF